MQIVFARRTTAAWSASPSMSHSGAIGSGGDGTQPESPSQFHRYLEGHGMERLLTLRKAALKLDVSQQFLKRLQRQGRLRVVRLGRAVRVSEQELERLCRDEFQK